MADYTPNICAAVAITFPSATIALALRLVARKITPAGYSYDDLFAVIAYLGSVAYTAVALIWLEHYGLGRPIADGPKGLTIPQRLERSWLLLWLGSETYSFAIAFSKFAILAFYWRLFRYTGIRIPIQILSVFTVCWFILRLLIVNLQCIPIQALWDKSIKDAQCGIHEATFFFSTVLSHVLIDVAILVLPVIEVRKLPLPKGQKIAVITLFMFGAVVCLISIFVLYSSWTFNSQSEELTLEMGIHVSLALAEANLSIISASLPMLRPVFRRIIPRSFLTSNDDEQATRSTPYFIRNMKLVPLKKYRVHALDGTSSTRPMTDFEADLPYLQTHGISLSNDTQTAVSNVQKKSAEGITHGPDRIKADVEIK